VILPLLIAAIAGYLLGSLPFGYLVARAKGVNIFEVGSKNPGATNVRRVLGSGPGNLVFALDVLKGVAAAGWPLQITFTQAMQDRSGSLQCAVAGLIGAVIGHGFSCFTRFRGGKGVATSAGGLLVVMPVATLLAAAVWLVAFYATRYVSLASIIAALSLVVAAYFLKLPSLLLGLAVLVAVFVVLRHRANIVRLLNGTEHKFAKAGAEPKP